jgi:hypothetical protein
MSQFHLTLPSNASMKYYPDNTVAKYTTRLSNRIELDGDWEVALAEIIYPCSWYNIKEEDCMIQIIRENMHWKQIHLPGGYYSNANLLIKKCNDLMKTYSDHCRFLYDDFTKKVTIEIDSETNLWLSEPLSNILGLEGRQSFDGEKSYKSPNVIDLNRGFYSIFVYCDIVEHVPVGDTSAPLMRALNVKRKYGDVIHRAFDTPMYLPVQKKQFDTIEVNIMTDTGQPVPFEVGKSLVTLHFKRSSNPYFLPR